MKNHITTLDNKFDIVFITALPHTEYEAVMNLPLEWKEHQEINDDNVYHTSSIVTSDGVSRSIIATFTATYGNCSCCCSNCKYVRKI